jgi:hypothetical protein
MSTRNPERTGGLGRPQYANRLARYRGTSSPGVTKGTQEPRLPSGALLGAAAEGEEGLPATADGQTVKENTKVSAQHDGG